MFVSSIAWAAGRRGGVGVLGDQGRPRRVRRKPSPRVGRDRRPSGGAGTRGGPDRFLRAPWPPVPARKAAPDVRRDSRGDAGGNDRKRSGPTVTRRVGCACRSPYVARCRACTVGWVPASEDQHDAGPEREVCSVTAPVVYSRDRPCS
jgi:hypothetical protein